MSSTVNQSLPKKLVLVPDTNIFIEAKDLHQVRTDKFGRNESQFTVWKTFVTGQLRQRD